MAPGTGSGYMRLAPAQVGRIEDARAYARQGCGRCAELVSGLYLTGSDDIMAAIDAHLLPAHTPADGALPGFPAQPVPSRPIVVRVSNTVLTELTFLEVDGYGGDEPGSAYEELIDTLAIANRNRRGDDSADVALTAEGARELIDSLDNSCLIWEDKASAGGAEALRQSNHIRSGRALIRKLRAALEAAGESPATRGDALRRIPLPRY